MFQKDYRTHVRKHLPQHTSNDDYLSKSSQYSFPLTTSKIPFNRSNRMKYKQANLIQVLKQTNLEQKQFRISLTTNIENKDNKLNSLLQKKYNPTKPKLNNNIPQADRLSRLYFSSQKQRNSQLQENTYSNKFNNSLTVKSPKSIFGVTQKTSISCAINSINNKKIMNREQSEQQTEFVKSGESKIHYLQHSNTPNSLATHQRQFYFRKKPHIQQLKLSVDFNSKNFQHNNINKIQNYCQIQQKKKQDKQKLDDDIIVFCNQKLKSSDVKKKLLDHQLWFAESFKGRRPYNQDRYICLTNKQLKLRQKLMKITSRIGQSNNIDEQKINNQNRALNNKYWLFGVFDGHGGSKCSEYIKQNFYSNLNGNKNLFTDTQLAVKQTFLKIQQKFLSLSEKSDKLQTSGSCAVICMIKDNSIFIGNVGDSRALLLGENQINQITNDHKPDDKQQKIRIIRNGGKLYKDGSTLGMPGKQNIRVFNQTRIMPGSLNVSRTIGDIQVKYKKYGGAPGIIVPNPDVFVQTISKQYDHILLASDGLFQGLTNNEIHQIYKKNIKKQDLRDNQSSNLIKIFVKQLINKAYEKSNDNITIVCVKLPKQQM